MLQWLRENIDEKIIAIMSVYIYIPFSTLFVILYLLGFLNK